MLHLAELPDVGPDGLLGSRFFFSKWKTPGSPKGHQKLGGGFKHPVFSPNQKGGTNFHDWVVSS